MVNTTTEETACNVTKSVVCNAIQAWSGEDAYDPPTDAEKEACTYAPHACNSVAQNL